MRLRHGKSGLAEKIPSLRCRCSAFSCYFQIDMERCIHTLGGGGTESRREAESHPGIVSRWWSKLQACALQHISLQRDKSSEPPGLLLLNSIEWVHPDYITLPSMPCAPSTELSVVEPPREAGLHSSHKLRLPTPPCTFIATVEMNSCFSPSLRRMHANLKLLPTSTGAVSSWI